MSQTRHTGLPLGTWHKTFQGNVLISLANGRGQNVLTIDSSLRFQDCILPFLPTQSKQPPYEVPHGFLSMPGPFVTLLCFCSVSLTVPLIFFLFACVLSLFSHVWLFYDPMHCSLLGSSVHGILQAKILEWVAMPSSRGSSPPSDWTHVSCISCIAGGFFTHWGTWEVLILFSVALLVPSVVPPQSLLHNSVKACN